MPKYDAAEVSVEVGGRLITGFDDGDFVNVTYNNDLWTTKVGADGEGVQSKSNDLSGQIVITILPTSPSNALLTALLEALVNKGPFPVVVRCPNTGSVHVTEAARVKKIPDANYAKEASNRAWTLEAIRIDTSYLGSTEVI